MEYMARALGCIDEEDEDPFDVDPEDLGILTNRPYKDKRIYDSAI